MWLEKLVSSPLVTCCGTCISAAAVAAFTRLLNDWITRGFVTPTGGDTLPELPDPRREPPNCAEAALGFARAPAASVAATPTCSRNLRRFEPTVFFLELSSLAEITATVSSFGSRMVKSPWTDCCRKPCPPGNEAGAEISQSDIFNSVYSITDYLVRLNIPQHPGPKRLFVQQNGCIVREDRILSSRQKPAWALRYSLHLPDPVPHFGFCYNFGLRIGRSARPYDFSLWQE